MKLDESMSRSNEIQVTWISFNSKTTFLHCQFTYGQFHFIFLNEAQSHLERITLWRNRLIFTTEDKCSISNAKTETSLELQWRGFNDTNDQHHKKTATPWPQGPENHLPWLWQNPQLRACSFLTHLFYRIQDYHSDPHHPPDFITNAQKHHHLDNPYSLTNTTSPFLQRRPTPPTLSIMLPVPMKTPSSIILSILPLPYAHQTQYAIGELVK